MSVSFKVETKGRLFRSGARDVRDALNQTMQAGAEAGEQRLNEVLRPRPSGVYLSDGGSTGNYRRNIQTKLTPNRQALITDGGVVYGPWLEGVGSRNATTRFKGYASFRKTKQYLEGRIVAIGNGVMKRLAGRLNSG